MKAQKLKLLIVSERTRWHFHGPLKYFQEFEIIHLTRATFSDWPKFSSGVPLHFYKDKDDLRKQIIKIKPDLIQGLEPYYGYSRLKVPLRVVGILKTIMKAASVLKIPYFFHCLENLEPEKKYGALSFLMRRIARNYTQKAAWVFYLNKDAKKIAQNDGAVKLVPGLWGIWGVDLKVFRPLPKHYRSTLLFVGALEKHKGADFLIDLAVNLRQTISNLEVWVVGRGILENVIKNAAKQLGWLNYFSELSSSKVAELMGRAWVGVAPNREIGIYKEQVGMVNLEMLASGVALVTTKVGSSFEFIKDYALFCPQNDLNCLVLKCQELLLDKEKREKLVQKAHQYIKRNYEASLNVPNLEKQLKNLYQGWLLTNSNSRR